MTATISHLRPWIPELTLADRLRVVRRDYGRKLGRDKTLTTKEFALMLGIPGGTYGVWESGAGEPQDVIDTCKHVAEVTGCDAIWLAGFERPDSDPDSTPDQANDQSGWIHGLAAVA